MEANDVADKLAPVPEHLNIVLEFAIRQKWDIRQALQMAPELVDDAFNQVWFTPDQLEYVQTTTGLLRPGNREDFLACRRVGYIGAVGVYLADKEQPEDLVRFAWMSDESPGAGDGESGV